MKTHFSTIITLILCILSANGQSVIEDLAKIQRQSPSSAVSDNIEESPSLKGLGNIPQTDPYETLKESRQRDISTPLYQELGDLYNPSSTSVYDRNIRDVESLTEPRTNRAQTDKGFVISLIILFLFIMISAVAISLICKHYKKEKQHKDKKTFRVILSRREQLATLYFMYRMASIDGEFANLEQYVYTKMCAEFAISPNDTELITFIALGDDIPLQILRNANAQKQDYILGLLIIMMMADHKIENIELTFIGETAFKIGMSRERVHKISNQVMKMYAQSC